MAVVLLWATGTAHAQSWLDYDQVLAHYPWIETTNPAVLSTYHPEDSTQNLLGDARLTLNTRQGNFVDPNTPPHVWSADGRVRSIYRMGPRVVLSGSMDYSYAWGSKAGGSVWIDPERMAFDITQTDDSTRGNVNRETYRLTGKAGVDVGNGLSLGGSVEYSTASGAKRKDPRHTNSLMNCRVSAGASWQTSGLTLGANYLYGRNTEALKFSTVGRTDRVYHYLINHGAYFGREESTDGNGYVGSTHERPWLDIRHGLAAQAGYRHDEWDWGIESTWVHRHGHYGLESPSMIDFNRHRGDEWCVMSWWQRDKGSSLMRFNILYKYQAVKDFERTYRIITTNGVTDVTYYDDRLMSEVNKSEVLVTGNLRWGIRRQLPTWELKASLVHRRRSLTASVFPYYRQQTAHLTGFDLNGMHSWLMTGDQTLSLVMNAGWSGGGGTVCLDGVYQTPADNAMFPHDNQLYMMREFEYLTANRLNAGVSVRWSRPIAGQNIRLYLEGNYRYLQAFGIDYLEGTTRHHLAMSVGCQF